MLQGVRPVMNRTCQLLTYAYVNLLSQKMHITKKNTEALKGGWTEVTTVPLMFMSHEQNV